MHPSSSSPQWLCNDMPAMDIQWWSSRIVNVRTNMTSSCWIVFMTSLYIYYALCFVQVEHSVCYEPIIVYIVYKVKLFFSKRTMFDVYPKEKLISSKEKVSTWKRKVFFLQMLFKAKKKVDPIPLESVLCITYNWSIYAPHNTL